MASSCPAELGYKLEGTGMNRCGVSGSNFVDIMPASSPSSTTSSAIVCAASLPRKDTKSINEKQYQQSIQQLFEISGRAIQQERCQLQIQHPQHLDQHLQKRQVQQKKPILATSQSNDLQNEAQAAAPLQQNVDQHLELGQQISAMPIQGSSATTTTVQLQQCAHKIVQQMNPIQHFQPQVNQQEIQLPLTRSSASSTLSRDEPNSSRIDVDLAKDESQQIFPGQSKFDSVTVLTTPDATVVSLETALGMNAGTVPQPSPSEPQVLAAGSSGTTLLDINPNSGKRNNATPFVCQTTSTDTIAPVQSMLDSMVSTTPSATTVAPENTDTSIAPPPSASEEPKALAAVSSAGTTPNGITLPDINANFGNQALPSQMTSTDTNGFELNQDLLGIDGLDLKHVDGAIKVESVEQNIKEPNNPSILSISSPTGSTGVAPTCSASIPATHPSRGVALTCTAPISAPHISDQLVSATTSKSAAKANKKAARKQNSSLATNKVPPNKPLPNTPVAAVPQTVPPTVKLPEIRTEIANQVQREITSAPPTAASSPDDPKNLSKSVLSLSVIVEPSKSIPDDTNQKERKTLDGFVKSRLVMDNRRFAEWLMQVGLLRSHQVGFCRAHNAQSLNPLQLRMYAKESRFPHSGGYVWITKCCDCNFVSIFRDSIFEDTTQPPTVLLTLMYHWSCQTAVSNVLQWTKVDELYLSSFYTMMRSVCTVQVHSSTPTFGVSPKNNRVEVGVVSLGTTSADGKRDVKVEVLGIFDQETQKIRLRASEPIVGDTESRVRFAKILEPLTSWVSPKAVICTDFTVDKTALEELGFHRVDDRQSNLKIMDYLQQAVPKVFNSTLSVLSMAIIQQFLDELVWRESRGLSAADAFHNIIRDLSAQTRVDYGMSLIKRLPAVAADPFKDWSLTTDQISTSAPVPIPASLTVTKTTTAPAPTSMTTVLPPLEPQVLAAGSLMCATLADMKPNSGKQNKATRNPSQVTGSAYTSTNTIGATDGLQASATGSSGTTLPDMNVNSRKKNKSTPFSSQLISADTIELEFKHVDGATKLESFESTNKEQENLYSSNCAPMIPATHPSPRVALTCSASTPAPHLGQLLEVTTSVLPSGVATGTSTNTAAYQCNKLPLPPQNLDLEADSNHSEALSTAVLPAGIATDISTTTADTDSNDDALSLACTSGKDELVEPLLSKAAYIETRDKKGLTPLMLAATVGHDKVVEVLLNHNANIEAQDEKTKDTALALACSGGHFKVVELLLKRGANKEHHNVNDYSPLTLAAFGGHVNIIKLLLSNGAEINSRTGSKRGISPLMMAANNGHVEAVRILLEMGSDINAIIDNNGYSALTLACYYGRPKIVQLLLEKKANVEQRIKGQTPLQLSASRGYVGVGRVLLDYGADVNAPPVPSSRDTALTISAEKGFVQLVDLLLERGAQVDVTNKKGNSALWLAANGGHLQVVELLYKAKADIDFKDNRKVSCLMAAFRKGHVQLVEWMVKRVTQFPNDEEISRIITTTIDNDLLPKCQLCKEIICAAKDHKTAKANKRAAYLLKELDMEKNREDLKRAAAAKKREKKKQKKREQRQADGGSTDSNLEEQDNGNDNRDEKSYTMSTTADPAPTTSNIKETQNEKSWISTMNSGRELATEDVNPIEIKPSKRRDRTKLQMQPKQTKKSAPPPHVEDDSHHLSKRGNKRNKENVSNDTLITSKSTAGHYRSRCLNNVFSSNSLKTITSTSITNRGKPIKKEKGWKEVVRRRPLSSRENSRSNSESASVAESSKARLSIIHSSELCQKLTVPSNAISRIIGRGGCKIKAIEEITGAQVWIGKQRKGQELCTVGIKGMNECIQQAQRLISVLMNEPEKFDEVMNKFKATKSGKTALITQQACSAGLNKSSTGTTITNLVLQSKGIRTATTTPTTPPPSYNMNELAPSSPSQPSVSMAATSIAKMSALTSCTNSTSADQDFSPFNRPLSKAEGTSMPGICTRRLSTNVMDTAQDPGYRSSLNAGTAQSSQNLISKTVLSPTSSASITPIPSLGSNKAPVGSRPHLLPYSPCTGSLPIVNPILPQQKTIPIVGMEDGMVPQVIGPIKLPERNFSLAPGVGRPSRLQQSGIEYPPMFGGGVSSISITQPSIFESNSETYGEPTDGGDVKQSPHHVPILKFGPDYPVPIGTSYYDNPLVVSYLGPGLGPGVMNRMSDSPPNQLGFLDVSTKYRSAPATTSTICRVCYGSIIGTSFRCVQCEDYNMCCLCVTAGKHPQHPVIRTINSIVDRDTATMAAFGTSLKAETASAALIVQLMAKIAEQDAEIERLVSARSEAVALLSRSCDPILIAEKMEKMSRTS